MARFVRSNLKELKRERVGDYLCKGDQLNINIVTFCTACGPDRIHMGYLPVTTEGESHPLKCGAAEQQ